VTPVAKAGRSLAEEGVEAPGLHGAADQGGVPAAEGRIGGGFECLAYGGHL
jgi:hypothetical protein